VSLTAIRPRAAIEGGRVNLGGSHFSTDRPTLPEVSIGGVRARVVYASPVEIGAIVPDGVEGGPSVVLVDGDGSATLDIAPRLATGLHQVDNPVFDRDGNLYVTYSGTRGQQVPISIFRVRPNGIRETFSSAIVNPTSMAIDQEGRLYVSSRFEGTVYRVADDGSAEPFATDLGIACGLAFDAEGSLFVGDRSGTIFRVDRQGRATVFASLAPSVAAFHLAIAPDGTLHVTAPTLSTYDPIHRVALDGTVTDLDTRFGRPQGLAFGADGVLFVVEALAGASGLYRVVPGREPELVLAGPGLVGVAFDSHGGLVVCSNETAYRLGSGDVRA
jgi:sugar lactone lactonase YvrE